MDNDSLYIHRSHNAPMLLYHFVTPTKYLHLAITEEAEGCIRQICEGIELGWDWIRFIEVGTDKDHVHYLLQSTPGHSLAEIVRLIKSVTAKRVFTEHPEVKKMLWGGEYWSDGYFVSSVGKFTSENVIHEYIKNQGKEESYRQLYLNLPKGE